MGNCALFALLRFDGLSRPEREGRPEIEIFR